MTIHYIFAVAIHSMFAHDDLSPVKGYRMDNHK